MKVTLRKALLLTLLMLVLTALFVVGANAATTDTLQTDSVVSITASGATEPYAYAASLSDAIANANADDTITLLADVKVTAQINITKNVTIDGAKADGTGNYKITANFSGSLFGCSDASVKLTLQNVDIDFESTKKGASIVNGKVIFTASNCNLKSSLRGVTITDGKVSISNTVLIATGDVAIWDYLSSSIAIEITNNSRIFSVKSNAINTSGNGTITVTNSVLSAGNETIYINNSSANCDITLNDGAILDNTWAAENGYPEIAAKIGSRAILIMFSTGTYTITLNGNAYINNVYAAGSDSAEIMIYGGTPTVDVKFGTSFTGTQIIRKNGNNYYFYDDVVTAYNDTLAGDTVFTYSKTVADKIIKQGYAILEESDCYKVVKAKISVTNGTDTYSYVNFIDAFNKAITFENSATITLLTDITLDATLNISKNITIDGQGSYGVTVGEDVVAFTMLEGGQLALNNLTVNGTVLAGTINNNVTTNKGTTAQQFEAEGYDVAYDESTSTYTVVGIKLDINYVAQIGKNKYATLAEAINAAKENDVVVLLMDAVLDEPIEINKSLTIQSAFTITASDVAFIINAGTTKLVGGLYYATNGTSLLKVNGGTLNIYSGYFFIENADNVINIENAAVNLYGGVFELVDDSANTTDAVIRVANGATLNVFGGSYFAPRTAGSVFSADAATNVKLNAYVVQGADKILAATEGSSVSYLPNTNKASLNSPEQISGAQIRLNLSDKGGIRFSATISEETVNYIKSMADADSASCGMLVVALNDLAKACGFTVDTLEAAGVDYMDYTASFNAKGDTTIRANLSDISEKYYNCVFAAIAYIRYTVNGDEVYLYSAFDAAENARSLKQLSGSALADLNELKTFSHRFPVVVGEQTLYSRYTDAQRATLSKFNLCEYTETIITPAKPFENGLMEVTCTACGTHHFEVIPMTDPEGLKAVAEAKIGENYYLTLSFAFAAAQVGDTITLLKDIFLDETLIVGESATMTLNTANEAKVITIDGQKFSITSYADTVFTVAADVTLETINLTIINQGGTAFALGTTSGLTLGEATIINTTRIVDKITASNTITTTVKAIQDQFVAEGYRVENNMILLFPIQVGENKYTTLQNAIANAQDGDTITLLTDVKIEQLTRAITVDKNLTINGNGHQIVANGNADLFIVSANLSLQNLSVSYTADKVYWTFRLVGESANVEFNCDSTIRRANADGTAYRLYDNFAAAVQDAADGESIYVSGEVEYNTTAVINKNLTIVGENNAVISFTGDVAFLVSLNLTLKNLEIYARRESLAVENGGVAFKLLEGANIKLETTYVRAITLLEGFVEGTTTFVTDNFDVVMEIRNQGDLYYTTDGFNFIITSIPVYVAQVGETKYDNFEDAFAAVKKNGGTIVLLSDIYLMDLAQTFTVDVPITINGQNGNSNYKITVSVATEGFRLFTVEADLTLQNVDIDFKNGAHTGSVIYTEGKAVKITVNDSYLDSENMVIHLKGHTTETKPTVTISGSTLISSASVIFFDSTTASEVTIQNQSRLLGRAGEGVNPAESVFYLNYSVTTISVTNSVISGATILFQIRRGTTYATIYLGEGAIVDKSWAGLADYNITPQDQVAILFQNGGQGMITLDGDAYIRGYGTTATTIGNKANFTFSESYEGKQIIRLNGSTYYFYDDVATALGAAVKGDTLFTYSKDVADSLMKTNHAIVKENDGNLIRYIILDAYVTLTSDNVTTNYATLADAIAAAADGDTVTLLNNLTIDSTINKALIINGDGYTLHSTAAVAFDIPENMTLKLNNVALISNGITFNVNTGSEIELRGTTLSASVVLGEGFDNVNNGNSFTTDNRDIAVAIVALPNYFMAETDEGIYTIAFNDETPDPICTVVIGNNTTNYSSFEQALTDALKAATESTDPVKIILLSKVVIDDPNGITINAAVTFESANENAAFLYNGDGAAITVAADGVVFNNVAVYTTSGDALLINTTGKFVLNNSTLIALAGNDIRIVATNTATVDILGKVVSKIYFEGGSYEKATVNCTAAKVVIYQGETSGDFTVMYYTTLADAIANVASDSTITLLDNATLDSDFTISNALTILGNGHTLTVNATCTLRNEASLTLNGVSLSDDQVTGATAVIKNGDITTYFASLANAIATANAGNCDTITLLADATVTEQFKITKAITINGKKADGSGNYKIAAHAAANNFNLFTAEADLTLQNVDITFTNTGAQGSIIYSLGTAVKITVNDSYLDSNNIAIRLQNNIQTTPDLTISGSTLIANAVAIFFEGSAANVKIQNNSTILSRATSISPAASVIYLYGVNAKPTIEVTDSVISGQKILIQIRGSATPTIKLGTGAILDKSWAGLADYGIEPVEGDMAIHFHGNYGTIILDSDAYIKGYGASAITNLAPRITFTSTYAGTKIIYKSGDNNYYFFDTIEEALTIANGIENLFTYSENTANEIRKQGYATVLNTKTGIYNIVAAKVTLTLDNDVYSYVTLVDAINAANAGNGGIITLLADFALDATLNISKNITIDGQNIHSITANKDVVAFTMLEGGQLALNDLTVNGTVLAGAIHSNVTTNQTDLSKQIDTEGYIVTYDKSTSIYTVVDMKPFVEYAAQIGETKYATLAAAINAAKAGDTIILLADITVTEQLTITKAITIDGKKADNSGNYKITANADADYYRLFNVQADFTLQNVDIIFTNTGVRGSIIYSDAQNVKITVKDSCLDSANLAIHVENAPATAEFTICGSTVIANDAVIYYNESSGNLKIQESSTILARARKSSLATPAFYLCGSQCTVAIEITDSVVSGRDYLVHARHNAAPIITLGNGAVLDKNWAGLVDYDIYPLDTPIFMLQDDAATFILDGNAYIKGYGATATIGNADRFTFSETYAGTQIIRQNGNNYYFYDDVDTLIAALQEGDTFFTYNGTLSAQFLEKGYAFILVANNTMFSYYTSLQAAIDAANTGNGGSITLLDNATLESDFTVNNALTILGNGHTLTVNATCTLRNEASLTLNGISISNSKITGANAIVYDGDVTAYYTTLAGAIAAANAGNCDTITLLADATVTEQFKITKAITINGKKADGSGNYKIAAHAAANNFNLFTAEADLTLQNVDITFTNTGAQGSIIYSLGTAVKITVNDSYLDSNNIAIRLQNNIQTTPDLTISGSTLIANAVAIFFEGSAANVKIQNQSKILGRATNTSPAASVIYLNGANAKPTIEVTDSVISGQKILIQIRGSATPTIKLGTGAILDKSWAGLADYEIEPVEGDMAIHFHGNYGTIILDSNAYVKGYGTKAATNLATRFTFLSTYVGTQIIRKNGNNYYFYDDVATALGTLAAGDTFFTYNKNLSAQFLAKGYTVELVAANNAIYYYKTLAEAITAANAGDTVKLLTNITLNATLSISKSIVIDGQGTCGITAAEGVIAFTMAEGGQLALNNVTVSGTVLAGVIDNNVTTNSETLAAKIEADGYKVTNDGETYTVVSVKRDYIAQVGETKYTTLTDAIKAAAAAENKTVVLLQDITLESAIDQAITIDLNANTLTIAATAALGAEITVKNGTLVANGTTYVLAEDASAVLSSTGVAVDAEAKIDSTYYATLKDAIDAANAGNGGTITLLDDVKVTDQFTITKPIVINGKNGNSNYKIVGTGNADNFRLFNVRANFTLQNVNVTFTNSGVQGSIIYSESTNALEINVIDSYLDSEDFGIHVTNAPAQALFTISGSTVISNDVTIYYNYSAGNLKIQSNSKILARAKDYSLATPAFYLCNTCTVVIEITKSVISGGNHLFQIRFSGSNPTIKLGEGAVLDKNWEKLESDYSITPNTAAAFIFQYNGGTFILDSNAYIGGTGATVARFQFSETYKGTQIIRLRGSSYYFYDDVDTAMGAAAATDTVFTYSEATATEIEARGYIVEKNGQIYTVVGKTTTKYVAQIGDQKYGTLEEAFAAATNGCTIKLLADVKVTAQIDITKNVTIDGAKAAGTGKYKITASLTGKNCMFNPSDVSICLTLQNLDIDIESTWEPAGVVNSKAIITISNCNLTSQQRGMTLMGGKVSISDSVIVTGSAVIWDYKSSSMEIEITNSKLFSTNSKAIPSSGNTKITVTNSVIAAKQDAIDLTPNGDNKCDIIITNNSKIFSVNNNAINTSSNGTITVTNSVLSAGNETIYIKSSANCDITLNEGAILDNTWPAKNGWNGQNPNSQIIAKSTSRAICIHNCTGTYTITLNGNAYINNVYTPGADTAEILIVGGTPTVDVKFDTSFTGAQIIRQSGSNYYFYDDVDTAMGAAAATDTVFTYSATTANAIDTTKYNVTQNTDNVYLITKKA